MTDKIKPTPRLTFLLDDKILDEDSVKNLKNTLEGGDIKTINDVINYLDLFSTVDQDELAKYSEEDRRSIAVIFEGNQYNFQQATVDTEHFKAGRYYLANQNMFGTIVRFEGDTDPKNILEDRLREIITAFSYLYPTMSDK